jgi:uncharacterized membrane protein (UPF0136 family)
MYQVYATAAYGTLLTTGGLIGFFIAGSIQSLLSGCITGAILLYIAYTAYHDVKENEQQKMFKSSSYSSFVLALVISVLVTMLMGERFIQTGKIFPAGLVTIVSIVMIGYYIYRLTMTQELGSNPYRPNA